MSTRIRRRGVDAVEVVGAILQGLLAAEKPSRLKDVEMRTGIPSAKLHRYLVSLAESGLVRRLDSGHYDFGLLAYQIGQRATQGTDLLAVVTPMVKEYCEEIGQTCGIGLWIEQGVTMVRWFQPDRDASIFLKPGLRVPLTHSSTGYVFAAYLSRTQSEPLVRMELKRDGRLASAELDKIYKQYDKVRRQGVAQGLGLRIPGLNSLSVPVFDRSGVVVLALTTVGSAAIFDADPKGSIARSLISLGKKLSAAMGQPRR